MITFTRQPDGTFLREGELAKGTRQVSISRDGHPGLNKEYKPQEAVEIIERAIASGLAPAQEYRIVEVTIDTAEVMTAREANLVKARAARTKKRDAKCNTSVTPV